MAEVKIRPVRGLRFDALVTLGSQALTGVLNFVAAVVVARALGPGGRGTVAVALALMLALVQLGSLGVTAAAPALAARDQSRAGELATIGVSIAWVSGGLLGAAVLAVNAVDHALLAGLSWWELGLVAIALPCALGAVLLQGVLLGQGRALAYNLVALLSTAGSVALLAVAATVGHLDPAAALAVIVAQYPASAAVSLVLLARSRPARWLPARTLWRELIVLGVRSYAGTVLSFLVIRLDLLLVNAYLGRRQAGFYSVAVVIAEAICLVPSAVAINVLPRVARGATAAQTAQVVRLLAIVYAAACLVLAAVQRPLITIVFGARFGPSVTMVYWLLPGIYCLGLLLVLSSHFAGRGYPWRATLIWAVGLLLNIAANMILLPAFGTAMAAVTSSVTYGTVLALHIRLFLRTQGDVRLRPRLSDLRLRPAADHARP